MAGDPLAGKSCDHTDCPAPALRRAMVYGQDLYFCNHHREALADVFARLPAGTSDTELPAELAEPVEPAASSLGVAPTWSPPAAR